MKRAAYIFLLLFLVGCGSKSELKGNRIRIHYRDSTQNPHEYYLLAVRDSVLVIKPGFYDPPGPPELLLLSKIDRIYTSSRGKIIGTFFCGVAGAAVLLGTDIALSNAYVKEEGAGMQAAFLAIPAIIVGAVLGSGAGSAIFHDEIFYTPSKLQDLEELRGLALYPDTEPPELQKIK